jgi:hypothetical protein
MKHTLLKIVAVLFILGCNFLAIWDIAQQSEEGLYLEYLLLLSSFVSFVVYSFQKLKER